jgi:hypothetical protein
MATDNRFFEPYLRRLTVTKNVAHNNRRGTYPRFIECLPQGSDLLTTRGAMAVWVKS